VPAPVIKKIYADGKFICEYESTGDDLQDAEVCRSLLKERGLLKKPTLEQATFRQVLIPQGCFRLNRRHSGIAA
jgi:hypothetical protein